MKLLIISLVALLVGAQSLAAEVDPERLLQEADDWRWPLDAGKVATRVQAYKSGELDKERSYLVYLLPSERRSLVLFQHQLEAGQKLLQSEENFWIVLPRSKRPVRITPMQKLMGEASVGDISTMTFSGDYAATLQPSCAFEDVACWELDLRSQRKGTTYDRVLLKVAQDDSRPLAADFFLASGKQAKSATFSFSASERRILSMRLQDNIQPAKSTLVEYLSLEPGEVDQRCYNPMFLVRDVGREC